MNQTHAENILSLTNENVASYEHQKRKRSEKLGPNTRRKLTLNLDTIEEIDDHFLEEETRLSESFFHEIGSSENFIGTPADYFEHLTSFASKIEEMYAGTFLCEPLEDPDAVFLSQPKHQDFNAVQESSTQKLKKTNQRLNALPEGAVEEYRQMLTKADFWTNAPEYEIVEANEYDYWTNTDEFALMRTQPLRPLPRGLAC